MLNNVEVKKVLVKCELTPEQLELYEHPDSFSAARELNTVIMESCNSAWMKREDWWVAVYQVMKRYKHVGAADTEVYNRIDEIFDLMQ